MAVSYEIKEGIKGMPKLKKREITTWIKEVAARHGKKIGEIGYLFCDDEHILQVNNEFLEHNYYTDIITFDYCEDDTLNGDIVISIDTVKSNADLYSQPFVTELKRVIIHGILHLCGINDKGVGEREIMETHENEALRLAEGREMFTI